MNQEEAMRALYDLNADMDRLIEDMEEFDATFVDIKRSRIWNALPRVKHLALYHKRHRVRVKNLKRLWTYG